RVRPHRARLLEDAGEVAGAAVQGPLEGLLRFGPTLVEGVLRLLEIEVGHVPAGPLDQVCGLRRVRAELGGRPDEVLRDPDLPRHGDRKSTRLNSSHVAISYAVFCLKKKSSVPSGRTVAIQYCRLFLNRSTAPVQ